MIQDRAITVSTAQDLRRRPSQLLLGSNVLRPGHGTLLASELRFRQFLLVSQTPYDAFERLDITHTVVESHQLIFDRKIANVEDSAILAVHGIPSKTASTLQLCQSGSSCLGLLNLLATPCRHPPCKYAMIQAITAKDLVLAVQRQALVALPLLPLRLDPAVCHTVT